VRHVADFDAYRDLLGASEALAEVYALASAWARLVVIVGESGSLLPSELLGLVGEVAGRPSVARRLAEAKAAA
jgi:hypothetical protein